MSELQTAWAAGLFEGEGCVSLGRRGGDDFASEIGRATCVCALSSTDKDVLERFLRIVNCGFISARTWHETNGYKPQWRWATKNFAEVEYIIKLFYPYMGERRQARMDEALALLQAKYERRRQLGRENLGGKRKTILRDNTGKFAKAAA